MILNIKIEKFTDNIFLDKTNTQDKNNILMAIENDAYTTINETQKLFYSKTFEDDIENILKKFNIRYKTQDELTLEQQKIYGKAINTPDFIVKSKSKYKWIDAKNFYGACTDFIVKKIKKQTKKYLESYGAGILIFIYFFCKELENKLGKSIRCIGYSQIKSNNI